MQNKNSRGFTCSSEWEHKPWMTSFVLFCFFTLFFCFCSNCFSLQRGVSTSFPFVCADEWFSEVVDQHSGEPSEVRCRSLKLRARFRFIYFWTENNFQCFTVKKYDKRLDFLRNGTKQAFCLLKRWVVSESCSPFSAHRNNSNNHVSHSSSNTTNGNATKSIPVTLSPSSATTAITSPTPSTDISPTPTTSGLNPFLNASLLATKYLGQKRHSLTSIGQKLSLAVQNQHRHSVELSGLWPFSSFFVGAEVVAETKTVFPFQCIVLQMSGLVLVICLRSVGVKVECSSHIARRGRASETDTLCGDTNCLALRKVAVFEEYWKFLIQVYLQRRKIDVL